MDSPNSILSELSSDDFSEEIKGRRASFEETPDHEPSGRPSKRARLNRAGSDPPAPMLPPEDEGAISEDTDGSVPASPHHPGMSADDDFGHEQVTVCKWDGCDVGDCGNMDLLVEHLHDDHIGARQKRYSCEWSDCSRKGIPHASGYALRAHMRSHTREKPFYCQLPGKPFFTRSNTALTVLECDRSFTRSDALAKHMRTVHETEALRPSDPVPKHHSSNPSNKFQRLRLVLHHDKTSSPASPSSHAPNSAIAPTSAEMERAHNNIVYMQDAASPDETMVQFPPDMNFTEAELSLPAPELFRLLRRQLHWATQEGELLKEEAERLEKKRKDEWVAKELLLENLMEAEWARTRRLHMEQGILDTPASWKTIEEDVEPARGLEMKAKGDQKPWWREEEWLRKLEDMKEEAPRTEAPPPEMKPEVVVEEGE